MNIIFDFDGTICDSFSKAVELANDYLVKHEFEPITTDELRNKGIKRLIAERKLTFWQKLGLVRLARRESSRYIDEFKVFPGLTKVLKELHQQNKLSILTTNSKPNVERFLRNHGLTTYFDHVYSNGNLFGKAKVLRKLKPDIYIGDETRDIEAGKGASVISVAVTWGFESSQLLMKAKPDFIIEQPLKLLQLCKKQHQL